MAGVVVADAVAGAGAEERELVAQLVVAALKDAAPEEIEVFRGDREAFLEGRPSGARRRDEELGFGVEAVTLLTPLVVAAAKEAIRLIANAFAQSVQNEAQSAFSAWLRRVLHRHAGDATVGDPPPPAAETIERVRAAAFHVCITMGAPHDDADLVANAIAGCFATGATG
jgi:phosphoglycolate phosphatase-like HAD superfamily hydrolase